MIMEALRVAVAFLLAETLLTCLHSHTAPLLCQAAANSFLLFSKRQEVIRVSRSDWIAWLSLSYTAA